MAFDMYMFDQLAEASQLKDTANAKPDRGSNEDKSMAEAEKIADTSTGSADVSAITARAKNAEEDLEKSTYVGNTNNIEYDSEFLDYQTKIIDSINIAFSSKPLYQYLVKQMSMQRGKNNSYSGPKVDTTAVSTIKVPTYLINCLKQETSSLSKVKNGTMVVGFLVWYLGLNPADFEDSDDIQGICDSLGISASPSKMSAHTGNMVQNIDDRLNDFEDTMTRLINLVEHVNTNLAQSEQDVGKVLMLSCYNALTLMGRATLVKMNDQLDDIDILDNMKVWSLMKSVDSSWLYNSRSEGREQYKRKCERERKQVLYSAGPSQVVDSYGSQVKPQEATYDDDLEYDDSSYDDYYDDDFDEQEYSFDDSDSFDNYDMYSDEDDADLDEAIRKESIVSMKNNNPTAYLKYKQKHRDEED